MSKYFRKGVPSIMDMTVPGRAHIVISKEYNLHDFADRFAAQKCVESMPDLTYINIKRGNHMQNIADVACCFDTETTTISDKDSHRAYIYIWQFQFNDLFFYGRTTDEFVMLLQWIQKRYPELGSVKLDKRHKVTNQILIGIANLTFEFQFMCNWQCKDTDFNCSVNFVSSCFADKVHSPITCGLTTKYNRPDAFYCIDILRVGGNSLASTGKDYCTTQKLKGDLDYNVIRNSMTPLTDDNSGHSEMDYCRNDVVVGAEYMRFYLDGYVKQCKLLPITKTGLVRAAIAHTFYAKGNKVTDINYLFPQTFDQYYKCMSFLYRGGQTGTAKDKVDIVWTNVQARDFTSSYPAVMLQEGSFPVSAFEQVDTPDVTDLDSYADDNNKCWYATFKFSHICAKSNVSVESMNKTFEYDYVKTHMSEIKHDHPEWSNLKTVQQVMRRLYNMVDDNNKVTCAHQMTVMLTEQDWKYYRMFYYWDNVTITDFNTANRGRLPDYLTAVVKYYYGKKSVLKLQGLDGTAEYTLAKQMVNSTYGLCVQKMHFDLYTFVTGRGWTADVPDVHDPDDFNNMAAEYPKHAKIGAYSTNKFGGYAEPEFWLSPFWGIWITSHARRRILEAVHALGDDFIYMDTDSVYFKNADKHKDYFTNWNDDITDLNKQLFGSDFDKLGDLGTFDPVVIKWVDKDKDGNVIAKGKSDTYSFKTWGAKRYVKCDDLGHVEQTIAGLPKSTIMNTMRKNKDKLGYSDLSDKDLAFKAFDFFKPGMRLELDESNKLTTAYNDSYHQDTVTDAYGNSEVMTSMSSVALYQIPFVMTVDDYYLALVRSIQADKRF